jgi:hypothetical protein
MGKRKKEIFENIHIYTKKIKVHIHFNNSRERENK